MTKILYIPNGSYIGFYLVNEIDGSDFSFDLEEVGKGRPSFKTADIFIAYLLDNCGSILCSEDWYKRNGIEDNHKFLRSELEIIYD